MRQGWMHVLACVAVSCALVAGTMTLVAGTPSSAHAAASKRSDSSAGAKSASRSLRQFTGYVTAMDTKSVTVEKRGKKPETRVFVKHDEMRTTGEIAKESRVTVYYREADGKAIAQKMVAKSATSKSGS